MNFDPSSNSADLDAIIESCSRDVIETPNNPMNYLRLGECLCIKKMHAEAIQALQAATAIDFSATWFEATTILEQHGLITAAMDVWRKRLQFLVGLKPGTEFVLNTSVKLPRQRHFDTDLGRHAAVADIYASQGKDGSALLEFKSAVSCWGMAKYVKSEKIPLQMDD